MDCHFDQEKVLKEYHDPATHEFVFNQTMLRIKDPERMLTFYTDLLDMTLTTRLDFHEMKFTLYFLDYIPSERLTNLLSKNSSFG
jgi:lactoylglutathione lyase